MYRLYQLILIYNALCINKILLVLQCLFNTKTIDFEYVIIRLGRKINKNTKIRRDYNIIYSIKVHP